MLQLYGSFMLLFITKMFTCKCLGFLYSTITTFYKWCVGVCCMHVHVCMHVFGCVCVCESVFDYSLRSVASTILSLR